MSKQPRPFRDVRTPQSKTGEVAPQASVDLPPERGGYTGPEPTRFGDWEHKGRCTDF